MGTIIFEVECETEGTITAGDPSVGVFGPQVDDVTLSSVNALKACRVADMKNGRQYGMKTIYRNIDLLDGLDTKSRDIVIANILSAFHDEVVEAVIQDASE